MKNNRGFTLIEVIVSITILLIIGLAFFQFFITSQKGTVNSQEKLEAFNIAQMVFERVKNGEYTEITNDITDEVTFKCESSDCNEKYMFTINNHEYVVAITVRKEELELHLIEVSVTDKNEEDKSRVKGLVNLRKQEVGGS